MKTTNRHIYPNWGEDYRGSEQKENDSRKKGKHFYSANATQTSREASLAV